MNTTLPITPAPWGIEETTRNLYVGPLRADGSGKIAAIVYSASLFCITEEARKRIMGDAEAVCAAVNAHADLAERLRLAEDACSVAHSAMLGKVNPKSPAWGVIYAVQDRATKARTP